MERRVVDGGNAGFGSGIRAGISAIYRSLLLIHGIKIVLPLLIYFLFELIIILLYAKGGPGILDGFWGLFLPGRGSTAIRHYPQRLLLLPVMLGRIDIAFDILFYSVAQGITALLIAAAVRGNPIRLADSLGRTLRRYWHLAGAMIVVTAIVMFAVYLPSVPSVLGWAPRSRYIVTGGGIVIGILAQAFFLYTIPFILLNGEPLFKAIGKSFQLARRRYILSLTLATVPFLFTMPTFLLGFKAPIISLRTIPELIIHIQILGEIMKLISGYILIGGVTVTHIEENPALFGPVGREDSP